ncbi:MAG: TIM barrel protein, partial [Ilumatobacteraceae bacterium]
MKLGLLTAAFPDTPLTEVADWAAANGFAALEVACWPRADGPTRRYAGVSHIDCADLSDDRAKDLVGDLAERGVEISGLGYYPNPLDPDPEHREKVVEHLKKVIRAAALLGVPVVNTFIGRDPSQTISANLTVLRHVWDPIIELATGAGIKIG